jgi:hypothetical protein
LFVACRWQAPLRDACSLLFNAASLLLFIAAARRMTATHRYAVPVVASAAFQSYCCAVPVVAFTAFQSHCFVSNARFAFRGA